MQIELKRDEQQALWLKMTIMVQRSSLQTLIKLPVRQQPLVAIVIFMGIARKLGVIV